MRSHHLLGGVAVAAVLVGLTWWSPEAPSPAARVPAGSPSDAEIGARARLVARLGRSGRRNEANEEAARLIARAPAFSARQWVTSTYTGVRREEDREADIRLLVSLGLPEHPPRAANRDP